MKAPVDLHIHSCLSPCADDDMTPCDIAAMAVLKGLKAIAVTDHNTDGNAAAAAAAGRRRGLLVVPSVEATTREEVHALCYFPELEALADFCRWLRTGLPKIPNRPDFFGRQYYRNDRDEITGEEPFFLPAATEFSLERMEDEALTRGGVLVPAHVNRQSNSLLSDLGMIPPGLRARTLEVWGPPPWGVDEARYRCVRSSDAHTLGAILEPEFTLDIKKLTAEAVIKALSEK